MPRPRLYQNAAQKQAAYRARLARQTVVVDRCALEGLHRRLEQLREAVYRASKRGDDLARSCAAGSVDTMLEKMIAAFEGRATVDHQATDHDPGSDELRSTTATAKATRGKAGEKPAKK